MKGMLESHMKNQSLVQKERSAAIQIMRGIAILLVLYHHASMQVDADGFLRGLRLVVTGFHMPVFFLIAGYLFQLKAARYSENKPRFLLNKAQHLLIPYVFWTVILWAAVQIAHIVASPGIRDMMVQNGFDRMSPLKLGIGLLTYEYYYTQHLWFLYILFVYFLLHILIGKAGSSVPFIAACGVVGLFAAAVQMPHMITRFLCWAVFFAFGRAVGRYDGLHRTVRALGTKKGLPFLLVAFAVFSAARIYVETAGLDGVFWKCVQRFVLYGSAFSGSGVVYVIAEKLDRINKGKLLTLLGDHSLDIYLMHNPYFVAFSAMALTNFLHLNAYPALLAAIVIGVTAPTILSRFIIRKIGILSFVMLGIRKPKKAA